MIIVLEGIRKSGKTTFADKLHGWGRKNSVPVFRFYDRELQSYNVNQMEANFVSCMQFAKAAFEVDSKLAMMKNEPIVLFDRFHISELIFGYYLRQYKSVKFMRQVDDYLASRGAKLVLFDSETSDKRAKPGELLFRNDFIENAKKSKMNKKLYVSLDATDGKLSDDELEKIIRKLKF